tara:strand:+ start:40 stop:255 length:216 start_codon:yes stop_codon:yes gene_type:complete
MVNIKLNNLNGGNKMINHDVKLDDVVEMIKGLEVKDMERLERILEAEIARAKHQRWALENVLQGHFKRGVA